VNRRREFLVGLVIIAALVVAVLGTLYLEGTNWGRPSVIVEVLSTDVSQLAEGNAVKFRGVQVGRVRTIQVEPGGEAVRVTLRLDADLPSEEVAGVLLAPESFFGDWQAEIVGEERYPGVEFYDVPSEERARDTVVLGGYALPELSRLTASAEEISDNVAELSSRLEVAFNEETASNMASAVANVEQLTSDLRDFVARESQSTSELSAKADSALREIQEASRAARVSFARIEEILDDQAVDSIVVNVRDATANIEELAGNLSGSSDELTSVLQQADSAFARLDRLTAMVAAGEGTLGRLFTDSTLAVRAESALQQLDLLLQDLRENPRRYVRLSIF
jgi:phospholipid/cholesterol/gamma-HCH transport system substrate-binding protein